MDAMPVTLGQEIGGWSAQIRASIERILGSLPRLHELAIGGTAVGTGINAHPEFGNSMARKLEELTHIPFREARNHFAAQATLDAATEMSGQLKTLATALFQNRQRFALDEQRAAGRFKRNRAAELAARFEHHAWQNQSGHS
jgi:fumarate hydratase class II